MQNCRVCRNTVSEEVIELDQDKINEVQNWLQPRNSYEVSLVSLDTTEDVLKVFQQYIVH